MTIDQQDCRKFQWNAAFQTPFSFQRRCFIQRCFQCVTSVTKARHKVITAAKITVGNICWKITVGQIVVLDPMTHFSLTVFTLQKSQCCWRTRVKHFLTRFFGPYRSKIRHVIWPTVGSGYGTFVEYAPNPREDVVCIIKTITIVNYGTSIIIFTS